MQQLTPIDLICASRAQDVEGAFSYLAQCLAKPFEVKPSTRSKKVAKAVAALEDLVGYAYTLSGLGRNVSEVLSEILEYTSHGGERCKFETRACFRRTDRLAKLLCEVQARDQLAQAKCGADHD